MAQHAPAEVADLALERFLTALASSGFAGDVETGLGAREVASTDNSIYQLRPAAVVYPRTASDVTRIVRCASADPLHPTPLCARGGNTGANGQSLSRGVIVDFARHMTAILAINADETGGTVTVEPGVVLDQLNAALAPSGLFFPPMVSTASRATIGGMVATDASGKGSRRYGKTSDYIEALDVTLSDGQEWSVRPMALAEAQALAATPGVVGAVHREAIRIATTFGDEIDRVFPDMNRGLTGYNLQRIYHADTDRFCLASVLAGSEGTLAITRAITLRVRPLPKHKALAVVRYASFDGGLRDVERLLESDPLAVEILDDRILDVARSDVIWSDIGEVLGDTPDTPVKAISFVEMAGEAAEVEEGLVRLDAMMAQAPRSVIDWKIVRDPAVIARLWTLREKAVGLLARLGGGRQGQAFVEDTAVPPAKLADYVAEFRGVLDRHGLSYGMFGHADVGCLHVRPFLDLRDPAQADLIRPISDEVATLAKRYGGLLWGEHGRGFRGEYSPLFFGPTLYPEVERLKRAFDPANLFNPGKLASAVPAAPLDRIDQVPLRGSHDRRIEAELQREYDRAIACNGNGACFSWNALDAMCPSYKATRDRAQSPKGRAALLRAWARLASAGPSEELDAIEAATAKSLSTCLSCKACTTLCPVNVDVPEMKSRFLERYYRRHGRPLRHRMLAQLERLLSAGRRLPALTNAVLARPAVAGLVERAAGFVDLPRFAPAARSRLPPVAAVATLAAMSPETRRRTVILVEDSFTSAFDGEVLADAAQLLERLGYTVLRAPPRPNGKALHVVGLRKAFAGIARRQVAALSRFADLGVDLVGVESVTMLMFEQEYRALAPAGLRVIGLETLLLRAIAEGELPGRQARGDREYRLFSHCTEQALRPRTADGWRQVFAHLGLRLAPVRSGCCGMAGLFGHEREHQVESRRLFDLSWRDQMGADPDVALATGFSCRCQTERFTGHRPRHPIQVLAAALRDDTLARPPRAS